MSDQDPELSQLLASARDGMSPTAEDGERVYARVSTQLATSSADEHAPTTSASAAARALRWARLRWLAVGLGVGGLAGYAAGQSRSNVAGPDPAPQVASTARSVPEQPAAALPRLQQPPELPPEPLVASAPRAQAPDAGRAARAPRRPLREPELQGPDEVALMQRVNRALARREAEWALSLLRQLDRELPRGRLLEERAAGTAIARCMLDPTLGTGELASYAQHYPGSVHLPRVSQICTTQRSE